MLHFISQEAVAFFILAGPIPLSIYLLRSFLDTHPRQGTLHNWIVLGVLWTAISATGCISLGYFKILTYDYILVFQSGIMVFGLLMLLLRGRRLPKCSWFFNHETVHLDANETIVVTSMVFITVLFIWRVLAYPTFEYDSLAYHLPPMANWYFTGTLEMILPLPTRMFPFTWEAACEMLLFPFHEDFFIELPGVAIWVFTWITLYRIGRVLHISRFNALLFSSLFNLMPIVTEYVNAVKVDLPLAAFGFSAVYFFLLYLESGSRALVGMSILSLSLMSGIKGTGPFYFAFLSVVFLVLNYFFKKPKPAIPPRMKRTDAIIFGVVVTACAVIAGGFWYFRNYMDYGNPLGFYKVEILGRTIFPGVATKADFARSSLAYNFQLHNPTHWKILIDQILERLNLPFILATVLALFTPSAILLSGKNHRTKLSPLLFFAWIFYVIFYFKSPGTGIEDEGLPITPWIGQAFRYGLPGLGIAFLLGAVNADFLRINKRILTFAFMISVAASLARQEHIIAVIGYTLSWATVMIAAIYPSGKFHLNRFRITVIFPMILIFIFGSYLAWLIRDEYQEKKFDGIYYHLERMTRPGDTIAFLFCHTSYLLFGRHLDRRVVDVEKHLESKEAWLDYLDEVNPDYLVLGKVPRYQDKLYAVKWADDPGPFLRLVGDSPWNSMVLYRINRVWPTLKIRRSVQ